LLSIFLGTLIYIEGIIPRLAFVFGFVMPSFVMTIFAQTFFKSFELNRLITSKLRITEVNLLDALRTLLADAASNLLIPSALSLIVITVGSFVFEILYPGMGASNLILGMFAVGVLVFILTTSICMLFKLEDFNFFKFGTLLTVLFSMVGYLLLFFYFVYDPTFIIASLAAPALFLVGAFLFLSMWHKESPLFFMSSNLGKLL